VIEAATGAGKSHIIAALAEWINSYGNKKVLCLAPSKELTEQNHSKFLATGEPASIYCASLGKSLAHDVVFGTPQTVLNSIDKLGSKFAAVIVDECHGITPTIKTIIYKLKQHNPKLRVVGLSATPYRLGSGYIYAYDENGTPVPESQALNPYFNTLIHRVTARELIGKGFLTPPVAHDHQAESYRTQSMQLNKMGQFNAKDVEQAFEGHGRKTSMIVAEIVELSRARQGVIIFAATIHHAEEIMASLPVHNSAIVTGKTKKKDREDIIRSFKNKKIKYLVNVSVLTTGFDAPHVDVVAILRATESVGLLQQIIGRGLRLDDNKDDCLILDYAENIERHCPDGDVFNPQIKAVPSSSGSEAIKAVCPLCATPNEFSARPNPDEFNSDINGYFVDLLGDRIKNENEQEVPSHFGRRCLGQEIINGVAERCDYRWTYKECPDCEHENDIAARRCAACDAELVDPNEKLRLEFQRIKADPYSLSTDAVISWKPSKFISRAGNETLRVDYVTECRAFSVWYLPKKRNLWSSLCLAVYGKEAPDVDTFMKYVNTHGKMPKTISVRKDKTSNYFNVYSHNRPVDECPN
jgi:DNA repair protein RadD